LGSRNTHRMKVLLVSTTDFSGGASLACYRLFTSLLREGIEVKMLVRNKITDNAQVYSIPALYSKIVDKLLTLPFVGLNRENLWSVDGGFYGIDISQTEPFQWADIIHLHWINQGMLSLKGLERIVHSGKRIVITMHDMWYCTGICHYEQPCERYKTSCGHCPFLLFPSQNDLSHRVWRKKQRLFTGNINFITCSEWLKRKATESSLLSHSPIYAIPNPIDTSLFAPKDKQEVRKKLHLPENKKYILFVAQKTTDERKGTHFFIEAINLLSQKEKNLAVLILGGEGEKLVEELQIPSIALGYLSKEEDIIDIYNASDCFVIPSLQENLPNTIMEAMACGVPCVGFDVGGIPEMIDHQENGIVVPQRNIPALAEGISFCLAEENRERLSKSCVEKVKRCYSQEVVVKQVIQVYQNL